MHISHAHVSVDGDVDRFGTNATNTDDLNAMSITAVNSYIYRFRAHQLVRLGLVPTET